jgi:glutamate 5-kinase
MSLKAHKRIVIKIGSNVIASREKGFDEERMTRVALEMAELAERGHELFLVSSGAILCGFKKLGLAVYPKTLPMKQAAAAVGQSQLIWSYERLFSRHKIRVAQVLLTRDDIASRPRFLNARNTLLTLLKNNVLPIINENDTVATEEIKLGDNDTLAGQVAQLVDAKMLIILSDVDGLYTKDPRKHKSAERIAVVEAVTPAIEKMAGRKGPSGGTGGMASKVAAAKKAATFGMTTLILNGTVPSLMKRALNGEMCGTLFLPCSTGRSSKK